MKLWIRLAIRELKNNSRFSLFFILNLSLGLIGFIALDSFKISIQEHINLKSKSILSADLDVYSTKPLESGELELVESVLGGSFEKTTQLNFLSMIAGKDSSRLVQIVAVGEGYPLYGKVVLDDGTQIENPQKPLQINREPVAWVQPELLVALGLKLGDPLKIGEQSFTIKRTIVESPGISFWSAGIAYRVFIGIEQAEKTGLIRLGSRRYHHHLYKLTKDHNLNQIETELKEKIRQGYGANPYIKIQTHQGSSQQINRSMGYLGDYLGLVSLVALFLAGIGTAYLFRGYFVGQIKELAILMSLGSLRSQTYLLALLQITILGTVSALFASLLAIGVIPLFPELLKTFLPQEFVTTLSWRSIFLALLVGVVGSILFCLPVLVRIRGLKPMILLNESLLDQKGPNRIDPLQLLAYLPIIIVYWAMAMWQSNSIKVGSIFMGSLVASVIILGAVGWVLVQIASKPSALSGLRVRLVFRNLHRNRFAVLSSFLAIGIGSLLINLIPQLHQGLNEEISTKEPGKLPVFFLFDIQPEQVDDLKSYLAEKNIGVGNLSAMIRARLQSIEGRTYERLDETEAMTREQDQERRARSREYNLSYRSELDPSERIVEGRPFSGRYDLESDQLPEISMETRFADRLGLSLGDRVTFDVGGVPIEGKVVNFRKVKWNSFRPNFYILFQPGVLEYAPATFLATINDIGEFGRVEFQNDLVRAFPNISMVDVTLMIEKVMEITSQMSWALQVMALLAVFAGLVVVFSISQYNAQSRKLEINLLKVLGAVFSDIRIMVLFEFGLLGLGAALVGTALSILISFVFAYLMFESLWSIDWMIAVLGVVSITLLSMVTAYLGARKTLRQKPLALLKAL